MVHRDYESPMDVVTAGVRSWRTLLQSLISVAVIAAGGAVAGAGTQDLGTLAVMAGQAALSAVLAYLHNKVAPAQ